MCTRDLAVGRATLNLSTAQFSAEVAPSSRKAWRRSASPNRTTIRPSTADRSRNSRSRWPASCSFDISATSAVVSARRLRPESVSIERRMVGVGTADDCVQKNFRVRVLCAAMPSDSSLLCRRRHHRRAVRALVGRQGDLAQALGALACLGLRFFVRQHVQPLHQRVDWQNDRKEHHRRDDEE